MSITIMDVLDAIDRLRSLSADPFVSTVLVGLVWPLVQAALDRPWWTTRRRVVLVVVASLVLSVGVWVVGSYPWTVELVLTQASMILGIAWVVYQALSAVEIRGVRLLDWVGVLTPGGEDRSDYQPRHKAGVVVGDVSVPVVASPAVDGVALSPDLGAAAAAPPSTPVPSGQGEGA